MSDRVLLSEDEIVEALASLPRWHVSDARLRAEFTFASFPAAMGFMTEVAIHADKADHHPEWINVYNRVTVELTTHDRGGITQQDLDLAILMDQVAGRYES